MVFAHPTRRSDDDRLVYRFTRRVPKEVIAEFNQQLDKDTVREVRAIAQALTTTNPAHETRTMTTKRNATTKRAEPVTPTTKPEPKAKPVKTTPVKKAAAKKKAAKPTDRATILAKYMKAKLAVQGKCKIGTIITYHGRNEALDGKQVKVTGYETRGGVFVTFKDTKFVVSPHVLLRQKK